MCRDQGSALVLRCGDRLPNFRDGGLDFTRADGKKAMNGFPARNSGEEEDTDFRQKETDGSDGTIG